MKRVDKTDAMVGFLMVFDPEWVERFESLRRRQHLAIQAKLFGLADVLEITMRELGHPKPKGLKGASHVS